MTKDILITFDYELFLGFRSGSVQKCLIEPTFKILKVLQQNNCKSIFFVDLTYLTQLKKIAKEYPRAQEDYTIIINQLKEIKNSQHYIHYHIHTHWLDAIYLPEENEWDLSNKNRFALSNLKIEEVHEVFSQASEILEKELEIPNSAENPLGFRAGGLYLQPFETLKEVFEKFHIKYDFSVLKGAKSSDSQNRFSFDYSNCPEPAIYRFTNNVVQIDNEGAFIEVSLNQIELRNGYKIANGLLYRVTRNKPEHKVIGDGKASGNQINREDNKKRNYLKASETISIEMINYIRARLYMRELKKNNFVHFISHPKLFTPYSVRQFDLFLKKAKRNYTLETDFKKIINNQIESK